MPRPVEVVAHRGLCAAFPENTMPSFEAALAAGARSIELDIHLSRDGVPVVIHDATLQRTAGRPEKIAETDWKDLAQCDAGRWFNPKFEGTRIPSLEEVLEKIAPHAVLNVELKAPGTAEALAALLPGLAEDVRRNVRVISFHIAYLAAAQAKVPETPRGLLLNKGKPLDWAAAEALQAFRVMPCHVDVTREVVDEAHRRGYSIMAWNAKTVPEVRRLLDLGVDACSFDDAAELIAYLDKEGIPWA